MRSAFVLDTAQEGGNGRRVGRGSSHQPLARGFAFLEMVALARHEQTMPDHLEWLTRQIRDDGELRQPIVVDRKTLVILDGHHRVEALEALGCSLIPAYLVDYADPAITVEARRPGIPVTKESVIRTGLSGRPYPPKTSRHVLSEDLPSRPTPLDQLRRSLLDASVDDTHRRR